jgi:type VI secretion system secreted protein Hcp
MSSPAHLWFEDETSSTVVDSCLMPLHLGSIELKSISDDQTTPLLLSSCV